MFACVCVLHLCAAVQDVGACRTATSDESVRK